MSRQAGPDTGPEPELEFSEDFEASRIIGQIERREAVRKTGPGTIARRTLDALAERRRLSRQLADLEDYGDS